MFRGSMSAVKSLLSLRQYGIAFGCLETSHPHPAGSTGCLLELSAGLEEWEPTTWCYSHSRCAPDDGAA